MRLLNEQLGPTLLAAVIRYNSQKMEDQMASANQAARMMIDRHIRRSFG